MPRADNMDLPQFFSADLCAAAKIDSATLKNWISREPHAIRLGAEDRRAVGAGRPHLFTLRTVMMVAICAEFVVVGLPPRRAGAFAELFMCFGEGRQGHQPKGRDPGELFPSGRTVIVAYPAGWQNGQELWASNVQHVTAQTPVSKLFEPKGVREIVAAVIVDVTTIHQRVRSSLGLPAHRGSANSL